MSLSSLDSTKKVIIFGSTGAIGTELAILLSTEHSGWDIMAVTRDTNKKTSRLASLELPRVTMVQGDPLDANSVAELSATCDILFCCVGFEKYEARYWSKHWPEVVKNLLNANNQANSPSGGRSKKQQQQRVVFCDNIYAYGCGHATPISVSTPTVEASLNKGKPNVRSWMHQVFAKHMQEHPGTLTVVGSADFFGPHCTTNSFLGDPVTRNIIQGKNALAIGSVQPIHDFCYAPDLVRSLAIVAVQDDDKAYDHFWICPHAIHNKSIQEIANDIAAKVHHPLGTKEETNQKPKNVKFSTLNLFMLYLLSPFMGFMREMIEMNKFWTLDYQVDDSDFCETFGVKATDYDVALQSLVDFYQKRS